MSWFQGKWKVLSNCQTTEKDLIILKFHLNDLQKRLGQDVKLKLLCGADLVESFNVPGLWKEDDIKAIVSDYGLAIINRAGSNPEKFIYENDTLYANKVIFFS